MRTRFFSRLTVGIISAAALWTATAAADDVAVAEKPDVARPSEQRTGHGVGIGGENGLFGRAYEQGLRIRIPILAHFGIDLRGVSALGDQAGELWYVGGRLELVGRSPVYLNLVRLYGGGGPEVVTRIQGTAGDKTLVGGGGQFGFEFFVHPKMSFFAEIGGHSGNELTGGGTALAGMMFYPFSGP